MTPSAPTALGSSIRVPDLSQARVVLLAGGRSSEREVSLWTARGVRDALTGALATTHHPFLPREVRMVEIGLDGRWSLDGHVRSPAETLVELRRSDVVFSCLHGGEGEDGTIQGFLATSGCGFTGSGVRASALCLDKLATRALAQTVDVAVAPGLCSSLPEWRDDRTAFLQRVRSLSRSGWVIKPRCGGSSVATCVTMEERELEPAIEAVFATGDDVLVEARIAGVELSCGVLGNRGGALTSLPPIEIRPADGKFFDYQQKYASDGAREVCPPVGIGPESIERVRRAAERVHRRAGCDGYSRIDFIVPSEHGREREPVMLEVNTLPGMTARSLLPQEAAAVGLDYAGLCLVILGLALERRTQVQS